jgi:methionyl aminopeptidase
MDACQMPAGFARRAFFHSTGYHGRSKRNEYTMVIKLKNDKDIAKMRVAGRLAAEVLDMISEHVAPGVSTEELDRRCNEYIRKVQKATPANVGYHGFPKTLCTSVNGVVCHGIPSEKEVLKDGDIINIDVTVIKDGWHGDTSRMFFAGTPSAEAKRLVDTTFDAMMAGIRVVKPGARLGDVGHAIQTLAEKAGYSVVREYCGHGIGRVYHEDPQVLHYGRPNTGLLLKEGMTFTVEPMLNAGDADVEQLDDGWTVVTADNSLSAQWEHMIAVTRDGFEILTPWPKK